MSPNDTATPAKKSIDVPQEGALERTRHDADQAGGRLSTEATQPGDQSAVGAVRARGTAVPAEFGPAPSIGDPPAMSDKQSPAPRLTETDLEQRAKDLHAAIDQRSWYGGASPDTDAVKRILAPVSAAEDEKRLEQLYKITVGDDGKKQDLREALQGHLTEYDYRQTESMLNRSGSLTNDAGNLMAAMTLAKTDKARGSAEVVAALATLNSKDLAALDRDFTKQYGRSYKDALENNNDINPETKKALGTLEKGSENWQNDKDSVKQLAQLATESGNKNLLATSLGVDTPAAKLARQELLNNKGFQGKFSTNFATPDYSEMAADVPSVPLPKADWKQDVDPVALDYLQEGRISLKTIAEQDTNHGFLNNKDNLELAVRNASAQEKALYQDGQKPDGSQEAKDYYKKVHDAFVAGGTSREVAVWEDQLQNGRPTIVSDMAKTHSDGVFGGHNTNDLMTKVENLSKDDWTKLQSADAGAFKDQIKKSLDTYATSAESDRVMNLLNAKAAAPSFEASEQVKRTFGDALDDNKSTSSVKSLLGIGEVEQTKAAMQRLTEFTPAEIKQYNSDPKFKGDVDKFVSSLSDDTQKQLAQNIMNRVKQGAEPVQLSAVDKVLAAKIQGQEPAEVMSLAEKALQDKGLRERLTKDDATLSPEDKVLKDTISTTVNGLVRQKLGYGEGTDQAADAYTKKYSDALFNNGQLSASDKLDLSLPQKDVIAQLAATPESQHADVMNRLTPQEQEVVKAAAQNPAGKLDLADRMRTFAINSDSDYTQFQPELSKLSPEDKQKLRDEYSSKYHTDLDQDFLSRIPSGNEQSDYKSLLNASDGDGRQDFYDRYHQLLQSDSGITIDGTQSTAQKAAQQTESALSDYQRISKTLPLEQQQSLDKYFGQALEQNKQSKEKLAEIAADAAIAAAALAAAPATGGVSLATVASLAAAAGAVARPAILKAIEGNDFDGSTSNVLRQAEIGAFSSTLNFIGAEAFVGAGQIAANAGRTLADGALNTLGESTMQAAEQQTLRSGLTKLVARYGDSSTPLTEVQANALRQDVTQMVEKTASGSSQAERDKMTSSILDSFTHTVDAETTRMKQVLAERTLSQIAKDRGVSAAQNALVGSAGGASSEIVIPTLSGGDVDWQSVGRSALAGLGAGATIGAVMHLPGMANDARVTLRRSESIDGSSSPSLHSNDQRGEVIIRQSDGQTIHLKPGDNQEHVMSAGDQVIGASANDANYNANSGDHPDAEEGQQQRQPQRLVANGGVEAPVPQTLEVPEASLGSVSSNAAHAKASPQVKAPSSETPTIGAISTDGHVLPANSTAQNAHSRPAPTEKLAKRGDVSTSAPEFHDNVVSLDVQRNVRALDAATDIDSLTTAIHSASAEADNPEIQASAKQALIKALGDDKMPFKEVRDLMDFDKGSKFDLVRPQDPDAKPDPELSRALAERAFKQIDRRNDLFVDNKEAIAKLMQDVRNGADPVKLEREIANAINPSLLPEEKAAAMLLLARENEPTLQQFLDHANSQFDSTSRPANIKDFENILGKGTRRASREKAGKLGYEWNVEHVRDSVRGEITLSDLSNLPKLVDTIKQQGREHGFQILKADTAMLLEPKKTGWRGANIDVLFDNGVIGELSLRVRDVEDVPNNHSAFVWLRKADPDLPEYGVRLAATRKTFDDAWNRYLTRSGHSESDVQGWLDQIQSSLNDSP
jgi:hypothetical protein